MGGFAEIVPLQGGNPRAFSGIFYFCFFARWDSATILGKWLRIPGAVFGEKHKIPRACIKPEALFQFA
jgi:hypothetical protein